MDREIAASVAEWGELAGPQGGAAPQVVVGGAYHTALGDASLIRNDMLVNIVTSLLGVLILILVAFRRPAALAYTFLPLLSGLILTFGFAKVTVGSLSSATSIVAALLVGLGIDFAIVGYGRFVEERRAGATLEEALMAMSGSSGRAVLVGAVTTTATFWAFTFTDFTGLRQMGLLTGTGILFCALAVVFLLPALLAWSEDHHRKRQTEPNLYIHSFGSDRLMRLCMQHRRIALLVGGAITAAALGLAVHIEFDESMKTMRPKGNQGIDVAEEVGKAFGSGFDSMMLVATGDTPEAALDLAAKAQGDLKAEYTRLSENLIASLK